MAEPETDDEEKPLTREEKMEWWQLCRIAIDYKQNRMHKAEALEEFSRWAELPQGLCWMMLQPLAQEKVSYLRKAFPDWITKDKEPRFNDASKTTRARNTAQRKDAGVDAVGRDNRGYWDRYRKLKDRASGTTG